MTLMLGLRGKVCLECFVFPSFLLEVQHRHNKQTCLSRLELLLIDDLLSALALAQLLRRQSRGIVLLAFGNLRQHQRTFANRRLSENGLEHRRSVARQLGHKNVHF